MGTFAAPTVRQAGPLGNLKFAVVACAGSNSYATGGDTLDLSSASANGFGDKFNGFNEVYCVMQCGFGAAADSKYKAAFIPAASGASATGKVKLNDVTAASGAEVTNATDLSGVTFTFLVLGR